jgi:hypothetical protein
MKAEEPLKMLLEMINKQASDASLWGVPGSPRENRLQQALRTLHRQVRSAAILDVGPAGFAGNAARPNSSKLKSRSIFGSTG